MDQQTRNQLEHTVGYLYSRETFGTVDGPGVRYVLFFQGCPLRCLYCHNPDSLPFQGGEEWTAGDLVKEVLNYRSYLKNGGVTFSGGEPFGQPDFLNALLQLFREEGIHTAVDTAGIYSVDRLGVREAVDNTDLILLDIKSVDPRVSREISGASSDNAFALLDYCEKTGTPVWIRQVLLSGYTLEKEQLHRLASRLTGYSVIERVELLPFHKLGEPKWKEVSQPYLLYEVESTTKEEVEEAKQIFLDHHLPVV